MSFMSNIIREIFVEDHVQQVSTSIKETLRDLNLLLHARDFKFCMSQAQWHVKIFVFFKKCFVLSASIVFVFPREQSIYEIFEVFLSLRSHHGRKLHFYFYFVSLIFNLLRISVKRNFYSHFIIHFSFHHIMYDVAQQL